MGYLSDVEISEITNNVVLKSFDVSLITSDLSFDTKIQEYNDFLKVANRFDDLNVSKTHLLFHKQTKELIGYITLSTDSIKLTPDEKQVSNIQEVPFASIPALKVGKLAINKNISKDALRKGYGSYMLEIARAFAVSLNDMGIACKFLTVDADIEYDEDTPNFYFKNGFIENLSNKRRNPTYTISMRMDIFQ